MKFIIFTLLVIMASLISSYRIIEIQNDDEVYTTSDNDEMLNVEEEFKPITNQPEIFHEEMLDENGNGDPKPDIEEVINQKPEKNGKFKTLSNHSDIEIDIQITIPINGDDEAKQDLIIDFDFDSVKLFIEDTLKTYVPDMILLAAKKVITWLGF